MVDESLGQTLSSALRCSTLLCYFSALFKPVSCQVIFDSTTEALDTTLPNEKLELEFGLQNIASNVIKVVQSEFCHFAKGQEQPRVGSPHPPEAPAPPVFRLAALPFDNLMKATVKECS